MWRRSLGLGLVWAGSLCVVAALAQWQTPDTSVPIGRGSGTGFDSTLPNLGSQALWGQSGLNPIFRDMVGGDCPNPSALSAGCIYTTANSANQVVGAINADGSATMRNYKEVLLAPRTYFVNSATGSDTLYNGLSATIVGSPSLDGPFATINKAIDTLSLLDANAQSPTISVAVGSGYTQAGGTIIAKNVANAVSVTITGTGGAVALSPSSGPCFNIPAVNIITPYVLSGTGGWACTVAASTASISLTGGNFTLNTNTPFSITGGAGAPAQINMNNRAIFTQNSVITLNTSGARHLLLDSGSRHVSFNFLIAPKVNIPVALTYGTFAEVTAGSTTSYLVGTTAPTTYATGAGAAGTTGTRHLVTLNAVVDRTPANPNAGDPPATYFPGNVAGSTATGGQFP